MQTGITADKVETYSDLIIGLPRETYETFVNGVDMLIRNGQHNRIQFSILTILPNAEMGNKDYQEEYGMVTVEAEIINLHFSRASPNRIEPKDANAGSFPILHRRRLCCDPFWPSYPEFRVRFINRPKTAARPATRFFLPFFRLSRGTLRIVFTLIAVTMSGVQRGL